MLIEFQFECAMGGKCVWHVTLCVNIRVCVPNVCNSFQDGSWSIMELMESSLVLLGGRYCTNQWVLVDRKFAT